MELAAGNDVRIAKRKSVLFRLPAKVKRIGTSKVLGLAAVVIVLAALAVWGVSSVANSQNAPQAVPSQQVQLNVPYGLQGRDGALHIINNKVLNMRITRAEKTDTVLIQGQRSHTINSKDFLIMYFEIDNPDNSIYFTNTNDLFRLVESDGKRTAPAVHQGTIDIRPDATKSSEIGFVVDKNNSKFTIEIGQTDNRKKTIEINF
jgi:hypothetical protein